MIVMNSGSQLSEMTTISHISFGHVMSSHHSDHMHQRSQDYRGCRLRGAEYVAAWQHCCHAQFILPGTFYLMMKIGGWQVVGDRWQVVGTAPTRNEDLIFFKMGTKWGPDFEWNGDLRQQKWGPNGDLRSVYLINWNVLIHWNRDFLGKNIHIHSVSAIFNEYTRYS